jgi:hypothetical protein
MGAFSIKPQASQIAVMASRRKMGLTARKRRSIIYLVLWDASGGVKHWGKGTMSQNTRWQNQQEMSNEDKAEAPNWVERRHRREAALAGGSIDLWNEIRGAIQNACDSFKVHYGDVDCKLENGKRILVSRSAPKRAQVVVAFQEAPAPRVSVAFETKTESYPFSVDDNELVFIKHNTNRLTADQLSERILEHLLFPEEPKRHD